MSDNKHSNISMTIKKMNIYGTWTYDTENKDCGICRNDLQLPKQTKNNISGAVFIGQCRHGFHDICINTWLNNDNISCPICRNVWRPTKKIVPTVYIYKN